MQTEKKDSGFPFDKSIDLDFIEVMYENDYPYIEQLFEISLKNYDADARAISENYATADLEGLRKAIHKMKAAFGFIGMLTVQNTCQVLEDKCNSAGSFSEIKSEIEVLIQQIADHKLILQNEQLKLKQHNSQIS